MNNFPIYILEGPDGSGKTTLAQAIGGHYIHCTYNDIVKNDMPNYMLHVMKAATHLSYHSHVVIDRWVMSESVYCNVYRNGNTDFDKESRENYYGYAIDHNAIFIHCKPENKKQYLESFDTLKMDRTEMYMDGMDRVYEEYAVQMGETSEQLDPYFYDRFKHRALNYAENLIKHTCIKA